MIEYQRDRREVDRCKHCQSVFVSMRLSPLPNVRSLVKVCNVCGSEYPAQRETDREEFRKLAAEFNG